MILKREKWCIFLGKNCKEKSALFDALFRETESEIEKIFLIKIELLKLVEKKVHANFYSGKI